MADWISGKKPIIALAPMADMTDGPFCRICREAAGKEFVAFREMVSAEAVVRGNEKTLSMCEFTEAERPLVIQIFGAEPGRMALAAKIIFEKYKPDGIDINMGCPVPKIAGKTAAGAALMKNPQAAAGIVGAVKAERLPVPVTVKTRLGWTDANEILTFAPLLEKAGADAIIIHGRTKAQGYAGRADWNMIGRAKKILNIPVLANGDIAGILDARQCLEITGADGIMIGRGALGNPWIFRMDREAVPGRAELLAVVRLHARLHLERYGEKSLVTFRKHLAWYFRGPRTEGIRDIKKIRIALMKVSSLAELEEVLSKIPV